MIEISQFLCIDISIEFHAIFLLLCFIENASYRKLDLRRTLFEIKYSVWENKLESSFLLMWLSLPIVVVVILSLNGCTRKKKLFSMKCVRSCNMLLLQICFDDVDTYETLQFLSVCYQLKVELTQAS